MSAIILRYFVLFLFFQFVLSKEGIVSKVLTDKKYDCQSGSKKFYSVASEIQCTHRCLQHDECKELNYKTREKEEHNCEIYTSANRCAKRIKSKGWKAVKVQRQAKRNKVYKSCKEIYNDDPSSATGVYKLESGEHFCFMETTAVSCEVGGWTLALKVNGSLKTFARDSSFWLNDEAYNVEKGLTSFYDNEAKFAACNELPFDAICIGMKVANDVRWLQISSVKRESLLSVVKENRPIRTGYSRAAWKGLIASSSLQSNCNQEGFNMKSGSSIIVRIGYVANDQNDCSSCDSFIGIGVHGGWTISCGNHATAGGDAGDKTTPAMCYILIK